MDVELGHGDVSQVKQELERLQANDFANWGFVLYRTFYGPESDQLWQKLLDAIRSQAKEEIEGLVRSELLEIAEVAELCQQLHSMLRLEAKSDRETLEGASGGALRQAFRDVPAERYLTHRGVFLYADEEVLRAAAGPQDKAWVKVVEVDYEPEKHVGNPRMGGQRYFGWMKAQVDCLLLLWGDLEHLPLFKIAPPARNGEVTKIWDGFNASSS